MKAFVTRITSCRYNPLILAAFRQVMVKERKEG